MKTEVCALAPADWQIKTIEEVCQRVTSGRTPSRREPTYYTDGGWPWVKTQELQDKWIDDAEEHITEEAIRESSAKILPANTVLVAMYGATVGQLGLLRRPMTCNQACCALIVNEKEANYRYLFYQLLNARPQLKGLATGAAQQNLSGLLIKSLRFPFPCLEEQRAIAHILGTLDDKIELNRRMNKTLEAIAWAVFKAWFTDFDPVIDNALRASNPMPDALAEKAARRREVIARARAEGRPTGLPQPLSALFPDAFEDSELGPTPRGWEVQDLDEIANYLNGLALQKFPPENNDSLPIIKIAQLRKGNTEGADRASANIPPEYIVDDGNVLFSWSGSLEVEIWCGGRGALNQHLFKVASNVFPKWFYYLWTKQHLPQFRDIAADKATTMGHIQHRHLSEAKALAPPRPLIEAMDRHFSPLIERIIANRVESGTLVGLRDTLLPKLLSGEIRLPDAERTIGGCV